MSKAICRYSGIEFNIEHFPYSFDKGTVSHPIFTLSTKTLLSLAGRWASRRFTETDTRLYFLALLRSTELVEFRIPGKPSLSICEVHMESMLRETAWIDSLTDRTREQVPRFVISQETASLATIDGWLDAWHQTRMDLAEGYHKYNLQQKQERREMALERLIKNHTRTVESYAKALAEWAAHATDFPSGTIPSPDGHGQITLRSYWIDIIQKCGAEGYQIWKIDRTDLQDLIEYLEENLNHGSIYSSAVMKLLRNAMARHSDLLGMGSPKFQILSDDATTEAQSIAAAVAGAPDIMPTPADYPNRVAYLRAKAKWDLAEKSRTEQPDFKLNGIGEL